MKRIRLLIEAACVVTAVEPFAAPPRPLADSWVVNLVPRV